MLVVGHLLISFPKGSDCAHRPGRRIRSRVERPSPPSVQRRQVDFAGELHRYVRLHLASPGDPAQDCEWKELMEEERSWI